MNIDARRAREPLEFLLPLIRLLETELKVRASELILDSTFDFPLGWKHFDLHGSGGEGRGPSRCSQSFRRFFRERFRVLRERFAESHRVLRFQMAPGCRGALRRLRTRMFRLAREKFCGQRLSQMAIMPYSMHWNKGLRTMLIFGASLVLRRHTG
jgi:hypothetical protein